MEKVRILGIVGSPRKRGNTAKLMDKAMEAIRDYPWVETDLFEVAGKKIGHCISCYKCMEKLQCVIKDGLYEFHEKWVAADAVLWAVPVYHMSVPSVVKALLDRFGNMMIMHHLAQGKDVPRFSKVCGVLTNGASRYGGQDLTLSFLVNSSPVIKGSRGGGRYPRGQLHRRGRLDRADAESTRRGQHPAGRTRDRLCAERGQACRRNGPYRQGGQGSAG